jgi:hypothetical protein
VHDGSGPAAIQTPYATSRRLRSALRMVESISRVDVADQSIVQQLFHVLQRLSTA